MELKHLKIFQKIAAVKSYSLASRDLYLSQPTLSTHIKTLENELGIDLFIRKKTRVEVSPIGQVFLQYADQILSLVDEAKLNVSNYKDGFNGSINIVSTHTICNWLLPDIIRKFNQQYPKVKIVLNTDFSPQGMEMLLKQEAHFAIIRLPSPFFTDHRFISKIVHTDESVLVASPEHRIRKLQSISFQDISKEKFIAFAVKTNFWSQVHGFFQRYGLEPNIVMELNDIHSVKLMVKRGMGIAFLPSIAVQDEIRDNTLITLPIQDCEPIKRYSTFIHRKDLILTGALQNFKDFIFKQTNSCL